MARSDLKRWLKQEASIFFLDTSSDGFGGFKKEWVRKYYQIPCRVYGVKGDMKIDDHGIQYTVERNMICGPEIDVVKGDKVEVGVDHFLVLRSYKPIGQDNEPEHTTVLLGRIEEEYLEQNK